MILYDFAHFERLLNDYVKTYHPSLSDDKPFITERMEETYSLYIELINDGITAYAAYDLAVKVLFDGL